MDFGGNSYSLEHLAAIDRLSQGRLVVAVGPGSSQQDFDSVGIDFDERWARLDESICALRALWRADAAPFVGRFYSTAGISLEPHPIRKEGPPIWLASWGVGDRAAPHRPPGRRMAGVRVQHHPNPVCRRMVSTTGPAPRSRQGPQDLPQRARDHVVLHHR